MSDKIQTLLIDLHHNHLLLESPSDIKKISNTLIPLGITSFSYTRIFNDSPRFTLTNRADLAEYCIKQGYVYLTSLNQHPHAYQSQLEYFLWNSFNQDHMGHMGHMDIGEDVAEKFKIGHGITILEKHTEWIDKYEYASTPDNFSINGFYINKLDFLNNFIQSFKLKFNNLIDMALKKHSIVPLEDNCLNKVRAPLITKREYECIHWLLNGKTVPEIALILNISVRTAEKFIKEIKDKLGCYTLFQLGNKVAAMGLNHHCFENLIFDH